MTNGNGGRDSAATAATIATTTASANAPANALAPTPAAVARALAGRSASGPGRRGLAALAVATAALTLAACASSIPAEVTTFHQLPPKAELSGRSFAVIADPAQRDSLEYSSYADAVSQALVRQGLVAAPAERVADYAVNVRYSTVQAQSYQRRGGSSVGVGVSGGGFSFGGLGLGIGIGIPIGGGQRTSAMFRHELDVDLSTWGAAGTSQAGTRVFEGRAVAENDTEAIASVMPALVEALFHDFPGANGATRTVDVELKPSTTP